jgi:signal transduction histidine kinase
MSLGVRMAALFGLLIAAVAVFMIGFFPARMADQARASTELRAHTVADVMATALAPALEFDDADNATKVLAWLANTPDAKFAVVLNDARQRFAAWSPSHVPTTLETDDDVLVVSARVVGRSGSSGTLYIGQSLDNLVAERDAARTTVVTATLVVLALGLLACIVLAATLVRPLRKLTITAREIARGARPPQIATVAGGFEVSQMTDALGTMLDRLNEANSQLVQASRHAGMAEVATGVLHNVGNILTSVNVAIELVNERVGALPIDRVRRAGELLGAARAGGAMDPAKLDAGLAYVAAIAERLDGDRTAVLSDMTTLRGHVDHVNRVVSMQNAYARVGGVTESTRLSTLIAEAVALGCPDPDRHGIALATRVDDTAHAKLDRHRVLQILVNLIANARDSIAAHAGETKSIELVASIADGWFEVRVTDSGGGIAPEQLLRIFSAGFTTKPKGHGYGLHSSALAAEQLGGTLRCTSPGVGQGACFVLRAPIERSP